MTIDPYLVIRAGSVYLAATGTVVCWVWRRPCNRTIAGGVLATAWNIPALLALHVAAEQFGWWHLDARGGLFLGMPVEVLLAWACAWGLLPAIACPKLPLALLAAFALSIDVVAMPFAAPVVTLGPEWLTGELVGLVTSLIPAQMLARWTARDERLAWRAMLQIVAFTGLVLIVIPIAVLQASGGNRSSLLQSPIWLTSLIAQLFALPALVGLTAVQEFVERGRGTPVPFDPPRRLVTSGIYAYLRNPMQLAGVLVYLLAGAALHNIWLCAAGVAAHLYSAGLAGWDEEQDLQRRFGSDWDQYRHRVRRWFPRWRPAHHSSRARLYVATSCGMCRDTGRWFARRKPSGMSIVPAESHSSRALTRIAYDPGDGSAEVCGMEAVARALEHIHLGWALIGFAIRLPVVRPLVQLLADASGTEPRAVTCPTSTTRTRA